MISFLDSLLDLLKIMHHHDLYIFCDVIKLVVVFDVVHLDEVQL